MSAPSIFAWHLSFSRCAFFIWSNHPALYGFSCNSQWLKHFLLESVRLNSIVILLCEFTMLFALLFENAVPMKWVAALWGLRVNVLRETYVWLNVIFDAWMEFVAKRFLPHSRKFQVQLPGRYMQALGFYSVNYEIWLGELDYSFCSSYLLVLLQYFCMEHLTWM